MCDLAYTKANQTKKNRQKRPNEHIIPEKIEWIHQKPCFVCNEMGVEAHHTIIRGMGGRNPRNDLYIIPLCPDHHRGHFSPHGRDSDKFYNEYPKQFIKIQAEKYQAIWEDESK